MLARPGQNATFNVLQQVIQSMENQEMPEAVPTTRKAQSEQKESREVPDICYMSDLLGGITRALTPDVNATGVQHCTSLLEWKIHGRYGYKAFTTHVLVLTSEEIHAAKGFALARRRGYLSAVYNRRRLSPPARIPTGSAGSELWLAVLDVEHWITKHLHDWQTTTPRGIAISMDNPEQFSRVFLIILELWVALDETVVEAIPLLRKYSPKFSIVSVEPLLLQLSVK
ncbi:hypothetical protein JB92DRAFT_2835884 [Gautieria morchelliformis]|nr:hypothetical protein JB92DRAFT_2835884 [Gautieria morchelliformis]